MPSCAGAQSGAHSGIEGRIVRLYLASSFLDPIRPQNSVAASVYAALRDFCGTSADQQGDAADDLLMRWSRVRLAPGPPIKSTTSDVVCPSPASCGAHKGAQ